MTPGTRVRLARVVGNSEHAWIRQFVGSTGVVVEHRPEHWGPLRVLVDLEGAGMVWFREEELETLEVVG